MAQETVQRHGGLLLEVLHIELDALGEHSFHPECVVAVTADEGVADDGLIEGGQGLDSLLELLQIEAKVLLAVGQLLDAEQLHGLFGGFAVVHGGMVHGDALEDRG